VLLVAGNRTDGYSGVLFARLNRAFGLGGGRLPKAAFLLEGHADLDGPYRGRRWEACYFQSYVDTFPKPPPKPGGSASITLSDGDAVRDRTEARVHRGTGREAIDDKAKDRWFRRLGCRRRAG
jgi:hypothetical protein